MTYKNEFYNEIRDLLWEAVSELDKMKKEYEENPRMNELEKCLGRGIDICNGHGVPGLSVLPDPLIWDTE